MANVKSSETQDTIVPAPYNTPALTNSTLNTPEDSDLNVTRTNSFLPTPTQIVDDPEASFIMPNTSFDVKQYTKLTDVTPEWEDEEVDEIMVLSPKTKSKTPTIRLIPTESDFELSNPSTIAISSFRSLQPLSSSSVHAKVSLAKHRDSNKLYAIKTFPKSQLFYDAPCLEQAMTAQMMSKLLTQMDLPFILKLRLSFQDKDALYLVTDFSPGGDMRTLVTRSGPLHPSHARSYVAELVDALCSLHASGIAHCAVTPEHTLIGADGHILLTGFSHTSVCGGNSPKGGLPNSASQRNQVQPLEEHQGNVNQWSAPEILLGWGHDYAVDSWGIGMILYFMLTGQHPFLPDLDMNVHRPLIHSMILQAPMRIAGCEGLISNEAYDMLHRILNRNPRMRSTIDQMKSHDYFKKTDWPRLRAKGYDAPLAVPPYDVEMTLMESSQLGSSDTLSGVHITGFDFICADDAQEVETTYADATLPEDMLELEAKSQLAKTDGVQEERAQSGPKLTAEVQDSSIDSSTAMTVSIIADQEDDRNLNEDKAQGEGSLLSNIRSEKSGNTAPSASTALYSCTSFGELREALKAKADDRLLAESSGLGITEAGLSGSRAGATTAGTSLFPRSGTGTLRYKRARGVQDSHQAAHSAPIGIMRKTDSGSDSSVRKGLGGGLGLRKYASLDFDLDTIVSLDADLSNLSINFNTSTNTNTDEDTSKGTTASYQHQTPPNLAKRRVSFVDILPTPSKIMNTNATVAPGAMHPPVVAPISARSDSKDHQSSPSWLNLSKYTPLSLSASPNVNINKLRKKRTASTPVQQLNTPHLQEKVALPAGLEQIGLGIGYTRVQAKESEKEKEKENHVERAAPAAAVTDSPRRSVSLGARCGALFNMARVRTTSYGRNSGLASPNEAAERASGESDPMEAVMREMYGTAWDAELGVGLYGGGGGGGGGQSSRRRAPGRVYSVHSGEQGTLDSTLRLVDPSQREDF